MVNNMAFDNMGYREPMNTKKAKIIHINKGWSKEASTSYFAWAMECVRLVVSEVILDINPYRVIN